MKGDKMSTSKKSYLENLAIQLAGQFLITIWAAPTSRFSAREVYDTWNVQIRTWLDTVSERTRLKILSEGSDVEFVGYLSKKIQEKADGYSAACLLDEIDCIIIILHIHWLLEESWRVYDEAGRQPDPIEPTELATQSTNG